MLIETAATPSREISEWRDYKWTCRLHLLYKPTGSKLPTYGRFSLDRNPINHDAASITSHLSPNRKIPDKNQSPALLHSRHKSKSHSSPSSIFQWNPESSRFDFHVNLLSIAQHRRLGWGRFRRTLRPTHTCVRWPADL